MILLLLTWMTFPTAPEVAVGIAYEGRSWSRSEDPQPDGSIRISVSDGRYPPFRMIGGEGQNGLAELGRDKMGALAAIGRAATENPSASPSPPQGKEARVEDGSFTLRVDLLSDASSKTARFCRSLSNRESGQPIEDVCTIEGIMAADGWPSSITASRTWKEATGREGGGGVRFARVPEVPVS